MADDNTRRTPLSFWVALAVFGLTALGGLVGLWWWWGVGFEEAETLGMAKPSTDAAMVSSFWVAIAGIAGLAIVGVVGFLLSRRTRT